MGKWSKPHPSKHQWSKKEIRFIKSNYSTMTNHELAKAMGLKITLVRMKLYEMGYKRMELEYWNHWQIKALKQLYKTVGDKELAEIFNKRFKKEKGWSFKHIEKKRKYLGLKRTPKELAAIKQRNVDQGRFAMCPVKRWETTGQAKERTIRFWRQNDGRMVPRIKINGRFIFWARWYWKKHRGRIPKNKCVVFKDNNPRNMKISNLILITKSQLARRNSQLSSAGLSDNYVAWTLTYQNPRLRKYIKEERPDLIELKRQQLLLNRELCKKKKKRSSSRRRKP